jgi:restriction endonuclease S subunit
MTWAMLAIGDFCRTGSGGTPSRKKANRYFGGNIPWVKSGELREGMITETEETITQLAVIESSAKFIPKGALLVAMYGATIGRVAKLGIDATSNQAVCHILPDESLADMQYMFYALQAQVPHWLGKGVGGAQPNISQEIIKNTVLPLPPLEEQRRIAAILDKASDIHTLAAEKARTCAASLYRSVLTQELDQPGMEWVQIGDVLEIARGGSPRPIQAYLTDDPDGINWIMIGDAGVGEKYITNTAKKIRAEGLSKTRLVKEGDLLLSNSMSFGRPYIMKTNGAIHDGWLVLRDAHATCNSDYLYHVLGSPTCFAQFARAAAGATVKNLNTSIVSSVEIPLPPLERQVEIAERLDAVELHIGRKFSSLAQIAEQLRRSLTSSLIQGFS